MDEFRGKRAPKQNPLLSPNNSKNAHSSLIDTFSEKFVCGTKNSCYIGVMSVSVGLGSSLSRSIANSNYGNKWTQNVFIDGIELSNCSRKCVRSTVLKHDQKFASNNFETHQIAILKSKFSLNYAIQLSSKKRFVKSSACTSTFS